jgi:molybdopterin-containing oxidoreductase family iron-sulfur binding subunit
MRGVVEKCNFCHGRLHGAIQKAAANGRDGISPEDYLPACVEACPSRAIVFGDLNDEGAEVSKAAGDEKAFRFLSRLGTEPKVFYRSERAWVRTMAEKSATRERMASHGS